MKINMHKVNIGLYKTWTNNKIPHSPKWNYYYNNFKITPDRKKQ